MNFGVVLLAAIMLLVASFGIIVFSSDSDQPYTDTMGKTFSTKTNSSHSTATNTSATAATFGGGVGIAMMVLMVAGSLVGVVALIVYSRSNKMFSTRR